MEIKHILVIIEPDRKNDQVLQRAERIALRYQASVELLMLCEQQLNYFAYLGDDQLVMDKDRLLKPLQKQMKHYINQLKNNEVQVQGQLSEKKYAYDTILDAVKASGADLLIKQTHHHSKLTTAFITPTDWHLIRECPIPLLLVKRQDWGSHLSIAAAIDPVTHGEQKQELDARILNTAHELACTLPAELQVVHSCAPAPTNLLIEFDDLVPTFDEYNKKVYELHAAKVNAFVKDKVEAGTPVDICKGTPEACLPKFASERDIDLMVIGAVSKSIVDRITVGNTAERVLDSLPCDLWLVK